jgi:hypothetical protein
VSALRLHRQWLRGDGTIDYGVPDLAARNSLNLDEVGLTDPAALSGLVGEETVAYVREAAELPPGATVPAEVGPALTVEVVSAILLGELLIHGFDIARTLGRSWPIGRPEANLVAAGAIAILPQFVNEGAAHGAKVTYELRMRGGPRATVRIEDGALRVEQSRPETVVDARISADPAAFLLVGYGRQSQWGPLLRGKLLAWGRKPWAAFRFASYLRSP